MSLLIDRKNRNRKAFSLQKFQSLIDGRVLDCGTDNMHSLLLLCKRSTD